MKISGISPKGSVMCRVIRALARISHQRGPETGELCTGGLDENGGR